MSAQRRIWQLTLLMGLVMSMTIAPPIKADPDPDTMPYNAVRYGLLAREQANLDQIGEETVSLKPVRTDPVFI